MATLPASASDLEEALRRCSPATMAAAVRFREEHDPAEIPTVVLGIIERYQPATAAVPLAQAGDETRLIEDLGLDSLTLLEIVMTIEEVLEIKIANEELRGIRTLSQLHKFLDAKNSGEDIAPVVSAEGKTFTREEILLTLPQQPPFLFVDEATIAGEKITAHYRIRGDEFFLEGHFKDEPVFPASIVFEAMGQAACLWLLEKAAAQPGEKVLFASLEGSHFYRKTRPGDRLDFEMTLAQLHEPLASFSGAVSCAGERVATVERLTLALDREPNEPAPDRPLPA